MSALSTAQLVAATLAGAEAKLAEAQLNLSYTEVKAPIAGITGSFTAGQTATIANVGTLTIAANGDYVFDPVDNWNGSVPVVTYTLSDGAATATSTRSSPICGPSPPRIDGGRSGPRAGAGKRPAVPF